MTQAAMPFCWQGVPLRPLAAALGGVRPAIGRPSDAIPRAGAKQEWRRVWNLVAMELRRRGYAGASVQAYQSILRGFYRFCRDAPGATTARGVRAYLDSLVSREMSWIWVGMNISVLRAVFDKLGGMSVTRGLRTPKRPKALPTVLNRSETRQLLAAAPTVRDQLLLGLLYGCGLKVAEACGLRWRDIEMGRSVLTVHFARGRRTRRVDLPPDLLPVLTLGVERCAPHEYVFPGRYAGRALSTRMAELIVRHARDAAGVIKPVTSMTLRHTFAVHCLEDGVDVRALQEALGHGSTATTRRYESCLVPVGVVSPLDRLRCGAGSIPGGAQSSGGAIEASAHSDAGTPPAKLFDAPLPLDALELPFVEQSDSSGRSAFCRMLSTRLLGRFLGPRASTGPPG